MASDTPAPSPQSEPAAATASLGQSGHAPVAQAAAGQVAAYLDMPAERRAAAEAHAALLGATAAAVAAELPLSADVDDFRRVLVAEAGA
jgi:hypothetical protein